MDKSFPAKLYESGPGAKYDESCKSILAEKIILAWIMNACVKEYKGIDPNEIARKYTEGEPEIGSVVETLLTDEKSKVQKDRIVEDEFGITMSDSLERKVNSMCNLSQGIIERTATKTWDEATETANRQNNELTCGMIFSMMKRLSIDFNSAADILNIPADKLETYRALVAELQK